MNDECPTEHELREFASATDPDAGTIENHLDSCERCRTWLDRHFALVDSAIIESPSSVPVPEKLIDIAMQAIGNTGSGSGETEGSQMQIDQFELLDVLGRGGMGVVYRARDRLLDREIALKVLAPALLDHPEAIKRFQREARAAAALDHPNVLPIHGIGGLSDADRDGETPYLTMPYIEGGSLEVRLNRSPTPMPIAEVVGLGRDVAAGLAAAHGADIIHRDIKPANILLDNGRAVIADFGLARVASEAALTREDFRAGTPQFMAPEQIRGEKVDSRADLFSLGALLYCMTTGKQPFPGESVTSVLHKIESGNPQPAHKINSDVPDWMSHLIEGLLEKNPDDRPATAAEVQGFLEDESAPGIVPRRVRRRRLLLGSFVTLLLFCSAFCTLEWRGATTVVNEFLSKTQDAPFSIRGRWGVHETLAGCWASCRDGDLIEIRLATDHFLRELPTEPRDAVTITALGNRGRFIQETNVTIFSLTGKSRLQNLRVLRRCDALEQEPIVAHSSGTLVIDRCEFLVDNQLSRQLLGQRNSLIKLESASLEARDTVISTMSTHTIQISGTEGGVSLANCGVRGLSLAVIDGEFDSVPINLDGCTVMAGTLVVAAAEGSVPPIHFTGSGNAISGLSILWKIGGDRRLLDQIDIGWKDSVLGGFRVLLVTSGREAPRGAAAAGAALGELRRRWPDAATQLEFTKNLGTYIVEDRPEGLRRFELGGDWDRYGFRP